jgi:hypothetical protein
MDRSQGTGHDDAAALARLDVLTRGQRSSDDTPLFAVALGRHLEGALFANSDRRCVKDGKTWGAVRSRTQRTPQLPLGIEVDDVDVARQVTLHCLAQLRCRLTGHVFQVRQPRRRRGSGAQPVFQLVHQLPLQQGDEYGVAGQQCGDDQQQRDGHDPPAQRHPADRPARGGGTHARDLRRT